jgi:hypothetical protein
VQRINGIGFHVIAFSAVEHQVRGKENQGDIGGQIIEATGDVDVYLPGQGGVFLGIGDDGNGRAMDDEFRTVLFAFTLDGGEIEQIQLITSQGPNAAVRSKSRRRLNQIISNQTAGPGYPS